MLLSLPSPSIVQVVQGLRAAIQADVALGAGSLLLAQLPTGVGYDPAAVTEDAYDAGSFDAAKIGDRLVIPDGLSMLMVLLSTTPAWDSSPNGQTQEILVAVRWFWQDTPTVVLTGTPERLNIMMANVAQATQVILGPGNLAVPPNGVAGFWTVPNSGSGQVRDPRAKVVTPALAYQQPKRNAFNMTCEVRWRGVSVFAA